MSYVRNPYEVSPENLEGFWGAIGGGLKRVGGFAVKAVTGVDVGGQEQPQQQQQLVLSDRGGSNTGIPTGGSFLDRLRARATERLRSDRELRDLAVSTTARYASPELLAAAAARQARAQPDYLKASVIIPALAVGALLLRRK